MIDSVEQSTNLTRDGEHIVDPGVLPTVCRAVMSTHSREFITSRLIC